MVFGVLVVSLQPSETPAIVFSSIFSSEFGQGEDDAALQAARVARKSALSQVVSRLYSESVFKRSLLSGPAPPLAPGQSVFDLPHYHDGGVFRLPAGSPFSTRKLVLWERIINCVCVFICDPDDNIALAESALSYFLKFVCAQFPRAAEQPSETLTGAEHLSTFLRMHLPHGQLLFASSTMEKQLDREAEAYLAVA
eukprot:m.250730 g.250730  ORF g.250730 m.250730 type:complete len:196 (+) comp16865_c0_seq1:30-617(+)